VPEIDCAVLIIKYAGSGKEPCKVTVVGNLI
jgi:hypothetical protein